MRRLVLVLAASLTAMNALAETPGTAPESGTEPVASAPSRLALEWNVPERCATEAEFRAWILGYTSTVTWVPRGTGIASAPDASVTRVAVVVEPERGRGSVQIGDAPETPGQGVSRSEVTHEDCREVALGLAFVLAVAFDPTLEPANPVASSATPEPPVEVPAPVPPVPPTVVNPLPRVSPAPPPPPPEDRSHVNAIPEIPVVQEWRVGVLGSLESGLGDGVAPGAEANVSTRWLLGGERDPSWFSPKLALGGRVAFLRAAAGGVDVQGEVAAGTLRLCPVWLPLMSVLRLGVCAGWEVGALSVRAPDLDIRTPASDLWSAGGVEVGTDLRLGAFELSVQGEGRFNAMRPTYWFLADPMDDPGTDVHEVPYFSAIVKISGSVRFYKSSW